MANNEKENAALCGCALAVGRMFVLFPLWYAILIGLLISCDAPRWVWILFFCYVPVSLVLHVFGAIVEAVVEA